MTSVTISADGKIAVSGSTDGTIRFWSMTGGHLLGTLGESDVPVTCVAASVSGRKVLRGSLDGQVTLIDLDGRNTKHLCEGGGEAATSVAFSSDEKWALAGFKIGAIGVWDIESGDAVTGYHDHSGSVTYLACDTERQTITSGSARSAFAEWSGDGLIQVSRPSPTTANRPSPLTAMLDFRFAAD